MGSVSDLQVAQVAPEQAAVVLAQVEAKVRRGLGLSADDRLDASRLERDLAEGRMLLWAVHDAEKVHAVLVLEVLDYPPRRVLRVVLVAGSRFADWADQVEPLLLDYKRLIGAASIETTTRDGFARLLRRRGWKRRATVMELTDGR